LSGTLFVVATPIGNLEDMTRRARATLAKVDLIAAEDTRHTKRLLSHIGVETPLTALHEHNEADAVPKLLEVLGSGRSVALVSDAGTPLVSDPGYRLVAAARREGLTVSPVPGASALLAALSVAGLPTDRFCFEGFLPARRAARRAALAALAGEPRTIVLYESVHRIRALIDDLVREFGASRDAFLAREMTKVHEQCVSATLGELGARFDAGEIVSKGEFVLLVKGEAAAPGSALDTDLLLRELAAVLPLRQAAATAARISGQRRNALYTRLLELKDESGPE
jgi:16S rRNA (cytidine1402-2'-O)-methyltransferase